MSRTLLYGLAGLLVVATGCQSVLSPMDTKLPWIDQEQAGLAPPERIIAVWTDTIYQHPGRPPTRGFGGRIYFYDRQGKVVPVSGDLTVYAYDDTGMELSADRPTRKYVFTQEQMARYQSESEVGASYNIWIPWDPVGGDEKHINLFPVFRDGSGKIVRGAFTESRLPGRRVLSEEERRGFYVSRRKRFTSNAHRSDTRQQTAQTDHPSAEKSNESTLNTTTIRVPESMAMRLQQNAGRGMAYVPGLPPGSRELQPITPNPSLQPPAPFQPGAPYPLQTRQGGYGEVQQATYHDPRIEANLPAELGQSGYHGIRQENTVSANARPWARQDPRSVRFEQPRFRVPALPGAQQAREPGQIRQSPLTPQYGPPSQP